VIVNAYGDILDLSGSILAGARSGPDSHDFADSGSMLATGAAVSRTLSVENTTLAVVATNAALDKLTASRIAAQATLGLGRVIKPFHSHIDGDLTIVLSAGNEEADANRVALMAGEALQQSVINAIKKANGFGIVPAWRDLRSG
jgi:L-aminopeptidase/D-esterase-like protein